MTHDFKSDIQGLPRSRIVLSSKTRKQIREMVGKCEFCGKVESPDTLEIFLTGMLSRQAQRPEENPAKILVVLCQEHYMQANEGKILKSTLRSKVSKRPDKLKKSLRALLQAHDRTYEGTNVKEIHDPKRLSVGAFLPKKSKQEP